ncbi:MAG: lysylphosphatidylglycerol synthase transmembrane domain-containing protein [Gemmatimonadota bacterium]
MPRGARWALLLAGAALYALVLAQAGIGRLLEQIAGARWTVPVAVGIYGVVYIFNAAAWHQVLRAEPRHPPFLHTLRLTISGFSINFITPFLAAGGEPYRVLSLGPWLDRQRAVGAVLIFALLHALSSIILWLSALALAFILMEWTVLHVTVLVLATFAVLGIGTVLIALHRHGLLIRLVRILEKIPLLNRLGALLAKRRPALIEIDEHITHFYRNHRRRFLIALVFETIARAVAVFELVVIARGVSLHLTYAQALCMSGLAALAINLMFFIPFELGWKEASLLGIFRMLGLSGEIGVYTSVVSRLRELIWIGLGVGMAWFGSGPKPALGKRKPEASEREIAELEIVEPGIESRKSEGGAAEGPEDGSGKT